MTVANMTVANMAFANMTIENVTIANTTIANVFNENLGQEIVQWLKFLGITLGYSILGGLAAIAIFYFLMCCLGFTCCGVSAGSHAASYQSSVGNVKDGSCFACCQSTGAGGGKTFMLCPFLFICGFLTTATLLIMDKVNHDGSHGSNNSTINATSLVADSAMNTNLWLMNSTMNATVLLMNGTRVSSL